MSMQHIAASSFGESARSCLLWAAQTYGRASWMSSAEVVHLARLAALTECHNKIYI